MEYHELEKIPQGFIIHHKDENPLNDDITNLRLMRKEDHNYLHQVLDRERFLTSEKVKRLKEYIDGRYIDKFNMNVVDKIFRDKLI